MFNGRENIFLNSAILAVGDERFRNKSKARMMELMKGGTSVLSHSLKQIEEMCDCVIRLDNHKIKMIEETKEVCKACEEYWAK